MARKISWQLRLGEAPPDTWVRDRFYIPNNLSVSESPVWWNEFFDWLGDDSRGGSYAIRTGYSPDEGVGFVIAFSEWTTAFEFRLRWV